MCIFVEVVTLLGGITDKWVWTLVFGLNENIKEWPGKSCNEKFKR